jgi:hypothetical protein
MKTKKKKVYKVKELPAKRMQGYTGMSRGLARLTGFPMPRGADGAIRQGLKHREKIVTARHEEREDYHITKGDKQFRAHTKAKKEESRTRSGRELVFLDEKKSGRTHSGRSH